MSIRLRQGRISDHCRRSRIRAFARTMSRRIIAVRASFGGFPASISWLHGLFSASSCHAGLNARVSVQAKGKDGGDHTHLRSTGPRQNRSVPRQCPAYWGAGQWLPSRMEVAQVIRQDRTEGPRQQNPRRGRRGADCEGHPPGDPEAPLSGGEDLHRAGRGRGEYSIAELCRREGIAESLY